MPWSPATQNLTRECIASGTINPDGKLHMKSLDGRYASISALDLVEGKLLLQINGSSEVLSFSSVEELIDAGWAVD